MAVFGVGGHRVYEVFETRHFSVGKRRTHAVQSFHRFRRRNAECGDEVALDFVEDRLGPQTFVEFGVGEPQE